MKLRITTFNCENLFGRYRILDKPPKGKVTNYEKLIQVTEIATLEPGRSGSIKPAKISQAQRTTTANAILAADPDVLAVQEVENLTVLRLFNDKYMHNEFDQIALCTGNDARGINVGFLVRKGRDIKIMGIRSHADEAGTGDRFLDKSNRLNTSVTADAVFSRDCLEVDVQAGDTMLTFLVNHFKAQDNKPSSSQKRNHQTKRVFEIVGDLQRQNGRFPIVLGDFNIDNKQSDYDCSLDPLLTFTGLYDPFSTLDANERWTHFYSTDNKVSKLDYILIDKTLRDRVDGVAIFREGLSPKCKQYAGARLLSMKGNDLEASDHCPTTLVLNI